VVYFRFRLLHSWLEVSAIFYGTLDAAVRASSNFDFNCVDFDQCTNISLKWFWFAGTPSYELLALRSFIVLWHLLASERPTCTVSGFHLPASLTTLTDGPGFPRQSRICVEYPGSPIFVLVELILNVLIYYYSKPSL
jgi:hypothetical protein